jgi:hypothetical protein
LNLRDAQQGLEKFIRQLVIDTPVGMVRLGDVPCQWKRFYQEAPRGHSKSTNLAIVVVWLLVASRRKLSGVGAATDRDQAKLLRDAIAEQKKGKRSKRKVSGTKKK